MSLFKEKIVIGYTASGASYVASIVDKLKNHYFDDENIYYCIVTDDRRAFDGIQRKNLIVNELSDFYKDFPEIEKNEYFLKSKDEIEYGKKFIEERYLFPFSTMRFNLWQAIQLGITNVFFLCTDTCIDFEQFNDSFFDIKPAMYNAVSEWDESINERGMQYVAPILKETWNYHPDDVVRVLDAAGRFYVGSSLKEALEFFNVWTGVMKQLYANGDIRHFRSSYVINDEYILAPIYNVFGLNKRHEHSTSRIFIVNHEPERERFWMYNPVPDGLPDGTGPLPNISVHGSHNGGVVIEKGGEILRVIEAERFLNEKNMGLAQYNTPRYPYIVFEQIMEYVEREFGFKKFDTCIYSSSDFVGENFDKSYSHYWIHKTVTARSYQHCEHHEAHANGVFYQSPYQEALVISFDAGGDDGKFNIYHGVRQTGLERIAQLLNPVHNRPHLYYSLGFAYMIFGHYLKDIQDEPLSSGNLTWPGKIMGLASYGVWREEWLPHFIEFYKSDPDGHEEDWVPKLNQLGEAIGVVFDHNRRLEGQIAYDVAQTSQRAFEECFFEAVQPYFDQYPDLPVCITGGCGLNILLNTRVREEYKKEVFVGPNPNDCGIVVGSMLKHLKPQEPADLTYKGIEVLDKNLLAEYCNGHQGFKKIMSKDLAYHPHEQIEFDVVVDDLINGNIIGVVREGAEHGPRALGNRSILCNPAIPGMKNFLNDKVKHREWYRPFAPVVRLEDVSKYFYFEGESRWMSFCPKVREEYREVLTEITHVDGTARVQTVTWKQNPWLYDLLTLMAEKTGIGVLLNTSFNINGKPIVSTYRDAFALYKNSNMDGLILEGYYLRKNI